MEYNVQDGWIKFSWKKGECREEIKLVAQVSGLSFDEAKIVVLRLYNHFIWLSQLRERSEKLRARVKRERQFALAHVKHSGENFRGTARGVHGERHEFGRYIRGLCALCTDGSFDQTFDLLLRAYSVARDDCVISLQEMASIVGKHVVYNDHKNPQAEKESTYRWLKRQFILLGNASSTTSNDENMGEICGASISPRKSGDTFLSWVTARELLRHGPHFSESSLVIHLPSLSKDLWSADLADAKRTLVAVSRS